ncbi:MAG: 5-formyltetrahydrofolate cyclo-ligase [Gammaproteobacteria bacterium]|nr:5-formyltetrahydrofolate cyclo-ligase [Gammaproteobacteria bacterium]
MAKEKMNTAANKNTLRRQFRNSRRALSTAQQQANATSISQHLIRGNLLLRCKRIGVFMAADGEPDTLPIIGRLWAMNKVVGLPVIRDIGETLEFFSFDPGMNLVPGRFDIPVPPDEATYLPLLSLDLLLAPLVAFDAHGTRLGMGGGYYDRTLGPLHRALRPKLIGLAHEVQRSEAPLPRSANDVPLHAVITETGLHTFSPVRD